MTNSPIVPQPAAMKAMTSACGALKGVIQNSAAPTKAAKSAPASHAR